MTVKELYEWAKENNAENLELKTNCSETYIPEYYDLDEPIIEEINGQRFISL